MIRKQLTLFIKDQDAAQIEEVRKKYNPIQYQLIKSHVTLCREEEMENIDLVLQNLQNLVLQSIVINFGAPITSNDNKGVLLPSLKPNNAFDNLRTQIFKGIKTNPKATEPHITLMHPMNSTCTSDFFEVIKKYNLPTTLHFNEISLIEQEIGKEWRVLEVFSLNNE